MDFIIRNQRIIRRTERNEAYIPSEGEHESELRTSSVGVDLPGNELEIAAITARGILKNLQTNEWPNSTYLRTDTKRFEQ